MEEADLTDTAEFLPDPWKGASHRGPLFFGKAICAQDDNFTIRLFSLHPSVSKVTLPIKPVSEIQCAKGTGYEAEAAGERGLRQKDPRTRSSRSESWPVMAPMLQGVHQWLFYLHLSLPEFMDFLLFGKTISVDNKQCRRVLANSLRKGDLVVYVDFGFGKSGGCFHGAGKLARLVGVMP